MKRKTKKSAATFKFIKNVYSSKVKVTSPKTGQTYVFAPGEVKPVNVLDIDHLLSLRRKPGSCCGGESQERHYFELAEKI
jgi:hypothetical protein